MKSTPPPRMPPLFRLPLLIVPVLLAACEPLDSVGRAPDFTPMEPRTEHRALYALPLPDQVEPDRPAGGASLWASGQRSLLGDRRASRTGDILTVVIEINDRAVMTNSTGRNRTGEQTMSLPQLFGLPQRLNERLPAGARMEEAVALRGGSGFQGAGQIARNEQLTLRVATTVVERLPNGVLRIEGSQEVRVNNELRELLVSGYIRPEDISRRNEIDYDRIAGARISYGGRGTLSGAQQPRYGQQIADILLPF
ncbi:MAG: flagellar basal body L-ring protein FlgH [Pararhodobacter sp.]|nr:flagellar basal body L-ring protein FlgH [Pararhodobacter sp.]